MLKAAIASTEITLATVANQSYKVGFASYVRGSASCRLFEIEGKISLLVSGISDLRTAYQIARAHGSHRLRAMVGMNLMIALARSGEQQGDIDSLRESVRLADTLLQVVGGNDQSKLINAK